jgi:hypothetical protein
VERKPNGDVELAWAGEPGKTYQVRCTDDFVTWINLGTPQPGGGAIQVYTHTNGTAGAIRQFYRLVETSP